MDDGKDLTRIPGGDRGGVREVSAPVTSATEGTKKTDLTASENPISCTRDENGRRNGDDRLGHGGGPALVGTDSGNTLCATGNGTGTRNRDHRAESRPDHFTIPTTAVDRDERGREPPEYQQKQPRIVELFRSALASTSSSDSSGDHNPSGSDRTDGDSDEEDEEGLLQVSLGSECTTDTFAGMQGSLGSMMLR